jgi:integrase
VFRGRGADGKRRYEARTFDTKAEAARWLTAELRAGDTGSVFTPSKEPLGAFLDRWLRDVVQPSVRPSTHESYAKMVRLHVHGEERHQHPKRHGETIKAHDYRIAHAPLASLRKVDIQAHLSDLAARVSPRTVRYVAAILKAALGQAVEWDMIVRNPATGVTLPRGTRSEMRALSAEEAQRLLSAAEGTRFAAFWTLLLTSGLRPGEALALRWSDFDGSAIRVQRALGSRKRVDDTKTSRSRVVPLPPIAIRSLQQHRALQAEARLKAGSSWVDHGLMFTTEAGGPLTLRNVTRRHFEPLLAKAKLPHIRVYDLRHSHATLLLAQNVHPKLMSERLGHATVRLTLDTYSHVLPGMQSAVADTLEAMLTTRPNEAAR